MRNPLRLLLALVLVGLSACCPPAVAAAQSPAGSPAEGTRGTSEVDAATAAARFESAWTLVDQRYWDLPGAGVDWDEIGERYRASLAQVSSEAELYELITAMYDEIGDDHSVFVPPWRVAEIRATYGDLPCVAVFGSAGSLPLAVLGQSATSLGFETQRLGNVAFGTAAAGERTVGYLSVADLATSGTAQAVREAVASLERAGSDALILDLRGNPGGRLVTMMQVAGVFTRGFLWRTVTNWTFPLPYPAIGAVATELPLVVLIDGAVNSAAEGLAGALQANGRALVVGERSAGNVEAVLPFCLRDGSQAWIATGVLAPLTGATWEGRGVVPDVEVAAELALEAGLEELGAALGER